MKKIMLTILLAVCAVWLIRNTYKKQTAQLPVIPDNRVQIRKPAYKPTAIPVKQTSLFIPYWTDLRNLDDGQLKKYDRLLYMMGGNEKNLDAFIALTHKKKYLVVSTVSTEDAADKIQILTRFLRNNRIQGLALDLEINSMPFDDTTAKIDKYVQEMYTFAKKYYIPFSVIVYGDTFYRNRPYNISFINGHSDEIMVMAYDFHKANGEPGPNFPLDKGALYSYDFKTMVEDFLKIVPREKLTVIFGKFGYDWTVDKNNLPVKPARALTYNQIESLFLPDCIKKDCKISNDADSSETKITYSDEHEDAHIVWYEDQKSEQRKKTYLEKQGIGYIAYWAAGFF